MLNDLQDRLEIVFFKVAIYLIHRGYGEACTDFDKDCGWCEANKVVEWMKRHIEILEN